MTLLKSEGPGPERAGTCQVYTTVLPGATESPAAPGGGVGRGEGATGVGGQAGALAWARVRADEGAAELP